RDVRIDGAVTDEDLRVDLSRAGGLGCFKAAVNADHAGEVGATSGELEHCAPAKAVAHGGDAPVDTRIGCEEVDAGHGAPAELVAVPDQLPDGGHHPVPIADHAGAVHIAGEHDQPERGELSRSPFRVIVEPGATMYDQHARSRAVVIIGEDESTELRI